MKIFLVLDSPGGCELELELEVAKQSLLAAAGAGSGAGNAPRLESGAPAVAKPPRLPRGPAGTLSPFPAGRGRGGWGTAAGALACGRIAFSSVHVLVLHRRVAVPLLSGEKRPIVSSLTPS